MRDHKAPSAEAAGLMNALKIAKIPFLISNEDERLSGYADIALFVSD
jgi:hypothetical protein